MNEKEKQGFGHNEKQNWRLKGSKEEPHVSRDATWDHVWVHGPAVRGLLPPMARQTSLD